MLMSWRSSVRSERCRSTVWTPSAGGSMSSPTRVTTYQVQGGLASVPGEEPGKDCPYTKARKSPSWRGCLSPCPWLPLLSPRKDSALSDPPLPSLSKGLVWGDLWGLEERGIVSRPKSRAPHSERPKLRVWSKERFVDREDGALTLKPMLESRVEAPQTSSSDWHVWSRLLA